MDNFTHSHLVAWLHREFSDEVIDYHNMLPRMVAVFESDPEYYGRQSWQITFDATGISRVADIPSLEPLFGGEQ